MSARSAAGKASGVTSSRTVRSAAARTNGSGWSNPRDQKRHALGILLLRQCFRSGHAHRGNRVFKRIDQRGYDALAAVFVQRLGRRLPYCGIRIAQSLDQQRHRALVGDLRQLKHGHAPHSGVVVRAARGDIVEIGIERIEQSHWRPYRSRYGMLTVTAPVGQSTSHGMQYQHSSYFM